MSKNIEDLRNALSSCFGYSYYLSRANEGISAEEALNRINHIALEALSGQIDRDISEPISDIIDTLVLMKKYISDAYGIDKKQVNNDFRKIENSISTLIGKLILRISE